jgi:hypothetical protein
MIFFKAKKFHRAIDDNDIAAMTALLDAGVSPDITSDSYLYRPIQRAVEGNKLEIARLLLDRGAKPFFDNSWRSVTHTLFSSAVNNGYYEMADMLLQRKPDFLNQQTGGYTPMARMAEVGNIEAIKYLLEKGADTTIKTHENRTPYFLAQKEGRQDVMDLLAPYYVSPVEKLPVAAMGEEGWKKLADDRIANVMIEKDIGYKITEIFNFTARERRTICLNIESKHEVIETKDFDEISNKALLETALAELQKQGGTASSDSITGIYKAAPKLK